MALLPIYASKKRLWVRTQIQANRIHLIRYAKITYEAADEIINYLDTLTEADFTLTDITLLLKHLNEYARNIFRNKYGSLMIEPIEWHIERRKISSLKDYPKNPRIISSEQEAHLKESLSRFGLIDKPIINPDGTIIGGHQRKKVLKKMGYKEVECNVPNRKLSEEEIQELNIRLNKNKGDWNYDILVNQWDSVELMKYGFDSEELIFEEIPEKTTKEKKKQTKSCPACGHEF